jgi:DNA invertase Pin-like site-specific DNA recombinase
MSSDMQQDSPATQRYLITEYCKRMDFEVVAWYVDEAVSAFKVDMVDRPAGSKLLADIKSKRRPFDAVVIVRLDRAFRNPRDQEDTLLYCQYYNCDVWEIDNGRIDTSTPVGEFMIALRGLLARMESRNTGKRVRDAISSNAAQGKWPSGYAPLGYTYVPGVPDSKGKKVGGRLEPNDRAADVVRLFEVYAKTGNAAHTAATMISEGIRTAKGYNFEVYSILAILRNPIYRQRIRYDGRETDAPDLIPRIVPKQLTDAVDAIIAHHKGTGPRARGSTRAYSSRLICANCGRRMVSATTETRTGWGGSIYKGWLCPNKKVGLCTGTRQTSERLIDTLVGRALRDLLTACRDSIHNAPPEQQAKAVNVERQRQRLEAQKRRTVEAHISGHLESVGLTLNAEIDRIDREIAALEVVKQPAEISPEVLDRLVSLLDEGWGRLTESARKEMLMLLGVRITLGCMIGERLWIELESTACEGVIRAEMEQKSHKRKRR